MTTSVTRPQHRCTACGEGPFQTTGDLAMHTQRSHWTYADRKASARLHAEVAKRRQALGLSPSPEFSGRHERLH